MSTKGSGWEHEIDERTTAWLDLHAGNIVGVTMRTERDDEGVAYSVDVTHDLNGSAYEQGENERGIWSRYVLFGMAPQIRAGGAAFVAAALDQEDCARTMWTRKQGAVRGCCAEFESGTDLHGDECASERGSQ